jgi:hypothetical protein
VTPALATPARASLAELEAERQHVHNRINDLYWTFTRTARGKPPAATAEGVALYKRRRELDEAIRAARRADAAVAQLRERLGACPREPAAARAHHAQVKADAAGGAPITAHGRHLLATRRPWPDLGWCGECLCGSTLLIADEEVAGDDA